MQSFYRRSTTRKLGWCLCYEDKIERIVIKFVFILSFLILGWTQAAWSQSKIGNVLIYADNMYRDSEKKIAELEGNIQIIFNSQHLQCDKARINFETKYIEASGHITFTDQKVIIEGDKITINFETNQGSVYNGVVRSGPMLFEGEIIHKTGSNEYVAIDGKYTTCNTCPAGWSFKGKNIKAEIGGYAHIKNSILKFGVFPVVWLPYLIVPLKSTRQTGLLIPTIDYSQLGGFAFSQSFFWAMSRSQDATITAKIYQNRGLKTMFNHRHVLTPNSKGEFDFATIKDQVFAKEDRVNKFRSDDKKYAKIDRWYLKYDHYYELPDNYIHRVQANLPSDLQYAKDFPRETLNHGDPSMENRMSLTKNSEDSHTSLDTTYYINMLKANPIDNNDDAVHRFPEIKYSIATKKVKNFLLNFDLDFTNFSRTGFSYDNLTTNPTTGVRYLTNTKNDPLCDNDPECHFSRNGKFDPQADLIRTGQRLDLKPSVSYLFKAGPYFELMPKLTYREIHYSFGIGDQPNTYRRYLRTEISGKTTLSRIFGDLNEPKASRYKHEFQPEIITSTVSWIDQQRHPFFSIGDIQETPFFTRETISDADLNSPYRLQFDYNDRLYDRDLITLVLNNKLMQKYWVGDDALYRQIASLRISQSYDAYQARQGNKRPYSDIQSILDVRLNQFETYTLLNYFPYHKVTNTSSRIKVSDTMGDFFQVGFNQQYVISADSTDVDMTTRTQDYQFSAGVVSKYLNLIGTFVYDGNWANSKNKNEVKSWAYLAQIIPPGNCWSIFVTHDQIIGGDTTIRVSFDFLFDGVTRTKLNQELLQQYGF